MNREMRRLAAREERLAKKNEDQRRTPAKAASQQRQEERPGFFSRVVKFLKEIRVELSRVSWPTRQQMIAFSTVTLITTAVLTLFVFLLDLGLREGIFGLLEIFQ